MTEFDVAIIGAGPAGSTAAICLHNSGLNVALVDRETFPRDKICGDALSPDVVNQLNKLPLETGVLFNEFEEKIWCNAVRFIAPNFTHADLQLNQPGVTGYVSPRIDFDNFLFQRALLSDCVTNLSGQTISSLQRESNLIKITFENGNQISAKIVLGADGAQSMVGRTFCKDQLDKNHHCAGLRQYYEGVTGFSDDNAVELHFYDGLLPGYFWIFPLPGNRANVGLGMLSSYVAKRKPNLKKLLAEIVNTHPNVKHRFKNAKSLESIQGFGLPLGSKKRSISGDGYLLLGDAAGLINPLSGEGIGNAIRSARIAADHVRLAVNKNEFDARFNQAYDREVYKRMWSELRLNYWIQISMRNPRLCNFIVKRAIGSAWVQELVLSGFSAKNIASSIMKS